MGPLIKVMGQSCQSAYELILKNQDNPLGRWESLRLNLHMRLCSVCRQLPSQFDHLRYWVHQAQGQEMKAPDSDHSPALPDEVRLRLEQALKRLAGRG
jgi:hypothetical protein